MNAMRDESTGPQAAIVEGKWNPARPMGRPESVNPLEEFRLGLAEAGLHMDRTSFLFGMRFTRLDVLTTRLRVYCKKLRMSPTEYGREIYSLAVSTPFARPSINTLLGPSLFKELQRLRTVAENQQRQAKRHHRGKSIGIAHEIADKVRHIRQSPDLSIRKIKELVQSGCDPVIALLSQRWLICPLLIVCCKEAFAVWQEHWGSHSKKFCGMSFNEILHAYPGSTPLRYIHDDALREWYRTTYTTS